MKTGQMYYRFYMIFIFDFFSKFYGAVTVRSATCPKSNTNIIWIQFT